MDAHTLTKLTSQISLARAQQLIPGLYEAWRICDCNTVNRRAGWFSQVLEESVGLSATTEFASGSEYEGRVDLGNTHPGDGVRFKGRGFIQLTGRTHYAQFGAWCHKRGLVPYDNYFIDHPEKVANDEFAWVSAAWYWMGNHDHGYDYLNKAADAKNLVAMTYMVNGGQNGFETRQYYYKRALALGNELMTPVGPDDPNWSDVMTRDQFVAFLKKEGYVKHAEAAKIATTRVRAAVRGTTNVKLHEEAPAIYVKPDAAVDARLNAHNKRISALEKKVQ